MSVILLIRGSSNSGNMKLVDILENVVDIIKNPLIYWEMWAIKLEIR